MAEFLKIRVNRGIVFAIVIIFLELIGFTVTVTIMIGKFADIRRATDPIFLMIFFGILGLWNGAGGNNLPQKTLKHYIFGGFISGLVTGILVGVTAFILGYLNVQGVDLREYLVQLSSNTIELFLYNLTPLAGAFAHIVIFTLTGFLGGLLSYVSTKGHYFQSLKEKTSDYFETVSNHPLIQQVWGKRYTRYILYALGIAALILLPQQIGSYWNFILGTVGIYILLGLGLNLIVGLSGQLVLGYVAFFAIGAYAFALLSAPKPYDINMNFWLALGFGILAATLTGVLLGLPILNLRGDYLAIVTLAFGEIIRNLIRSDLLTPYTLGPRGVREIAEPTLFGKSFSSEVDYMYIIILTVILLIFITDRIQNSRVGRAWLAIKDDQTVAQANGINTFKYKLLALALGAAFAGLAGGVFAARNQFTGPEDHTLMVSINVLCLVIVGGMGSIPGIILGAFVLKGIPEMLRDFEIYRMLFFGVLLIIMMIVRPEGLWPASRPVLEKRKPVPGGDMDKDPGKTIEGVQDAG